jgi:hypothetical protein
MMFETAVFVLGVLLCMYAIVWFADKVLAVAILAYGWIRDA